MKHKKRANGLSRDERELENLLRKHVVRAEFSKKGHIKYFLDSGKVFLASRAHGHRPDPRTVKNQLKRLIRLLGHKGKNPNLYSDIRRRYEAPYSALASRIPDDYDEIVLRNMAANPDSKALRRAYVAAKQAALDGDPRAMVVLQELEKLLAEESREHMTALRNVWHRTAGRLRGNPKPRRVKKRHKK